MKNNLIHICFILDESGSMYSSVEDVLGGFNNLISEQKNVEEGECIISLYRFSDTVVKSFLGKPVQEISDINYVPGGLTAMNDGIGTAIDEIGKWLNDMKEEDRPSKNMIIIMTDGLENASKKYTLAQVKEKIQHQTDKYNWSFVYMGCDLSNFSDADKLGITTRSISGRDNVYNNYNTINTYAQSYRSAINQSEANAAEAMFKTTLETDTASYASANNLNL